MGADLLLKHKDEDVASLGRSHKYYADILLNMKDSDSAFNEARSKLEKARYQFTKEMFLHIMALKPDNLEGMKETIGIIMEWYEEQCVKVGRTYTVIEVIDEYSHLKLEESI